MTINYQSDLDTAKKTLIKKLFIVNYFHNSITLNDFRMLGCFPCQLRNMMYKVIFKLVQFFVILFANFWCAHHMMSKPTKFMFSHLLRKTKARYMENDVFSHNGINKLFMPRKESLAFIHNLWSIFMGLDEILMCE